MSTALSQYPPGATLVKQPTMNPQDMARHHEAMFYRLRSLIHRIDPDVDEFFDRYNQRVARGEKTWTEVIGLVSIHAMVSCTWHRSPKAFDALSKIPAEHLATANTPIGRRFLRYRMLLIRLVARWACSHIKAEGGQS